MGRRSICIVYFRIWGVWCEHMGQAQNPILVSSASSRKLVET
jgi:hypothetical protein